MAAASEKRVTATESGLRVRIGATPQARRSHRHVWHGDSSGRTYCGRCGKQHPTEGRAS